MAEEDWRYYRRICIRCGEAHLFDTWVNGSYLCQGCKGLEDNFKVNGWCKRTCSRCKIKWILDNWHKSGSFVCMQCRYLEDLIAQRIREGKEKPCTDCHQIYPHYVMEYDHLNPSLKSADIAKGKWRTLESLELELSKCEPVCSNCHKIRTYTRRFKCE